MMKTVKWLFDYDPEETKDDGEKNESGEPKSILKGDNDSKYDKEKKKANPRDSRSFFSWSNWKREEPAAAAAEEEEETKEEDAKKSDKDSDSSSKKDASKRVSWRGSSQRKESKEEKRGSKRLSWGRSKNKRNSADRSVQETKERFLSNLGAINENGEYLQAKLEDSNIAGIGSQEDQELRTAAAKKEKAFRKIKKNFVGLKIWRVENKRTKNDCPDFGIKEWPKEEYGSFYSGDSYVVLNAYRQMDPVTRKQSNQICYDIHFWLGKESTQDEIGVAAYKTVELDAFLGGIAVHHREVQYHESKLFLSYFKELNYMDGGIESGFRRVKPKDYEPRLLIVRHVSRVTKSFQIPCSSEYMNHGDCFILDTGSVVYRWIGESSNFFEKNKSGLLQHNIVNSRNGKSRKAEPDEDFWAILGGEDKIRDAENPYEVEVDKEQRLDATSLKLYRISDETGNLKFTLEDEGKVAIWKLDPADVFLVHANIGLWIWVGSGSTQQEKSKAMSIADQYIKEENLPNTMTVTVIQEDAAKTNALFRGLFQGR